MVKKEYVKIIDQELKKMGSKVPKNIDLEKEHCLASLLYLAAGDGSYRLTLDQIAKIKTDEFSIEWNE